MKTEVLTKPLGRTVSPRVKIDKISRKKVGISKILVPIDFSESSGKAIDYAHSLSKRFGAGLNLVHIFEPQYPLVGLAGNPLFIPDSEVGPRVHRHLRDLARNHSVSMRPENIYAIKGRPFEEICRLAHKIGIDLIVVPTRGNTGLKHLVLGSTAERVVQHAPCPVLIVRPTETGGNGNSASAVLSFRKIVVPIDFSACSINGLAYAKALAREFGSTLVLLHCVYPHYYVSNDEYARYDFPLLMEQTEKAARRQLRELAEKIDWEGIKVESSLSIGHAGQEICDESKDRHASLIVTATHGNTGLKHVFLGSTAEFVVRHANCPVLVVPSYQRPSITSTKT